MLGYRAVIGILNMASAYLVLLLVYASYSDLTLALGLTNVTCEASEVLACENGEPGVHFERSVDACNFYEYWGTCLKFLQASCSGDPFYEERVYSHHFDGSFYCPWLFPGDQPAPGCDKRKMLQCKLMTEGFDYRSCSYLEKYKACLETFRGNCSGYNIYQGQLDGWKFSAHLDCPQLLGCNMTVYESCWDRIELNKVNIYDLSSFKLLCDDQFDQTMRCIQDQMDRCQYRESSEIYKRNWEYQMLVYSCNGVPECNLAQIHQCALDNYSENLWMMVVPTPKQTVAVCRNYQSYINCIAPYKEGCIQNKHRLQRAGSESLSAVVDRMETLSKYVTLLCIEHHQDILQYGTGCYDVAPSKSMLVSCEYRRTPIKDYAPDVQRCESLQNETACIKLALSMSDKCGEESEETALKVATTFEKFLLSLHHGFTCDGLKPVILTESPTTEKPTTQRSTTKNPAPIVTQTMTSQREASAAHRTHCRPWTLTALVVHIVFLLI